MIHPTAIIGKQSQIGENVDIGPYAIVGDNVVIGAGTHIGPHANIEGYTELGPGCRIFQFASIGAPPQDLKYKGEETWVKIGKECTIREFATIHRGTNLGGGVTRIGDNCLLMAYSHVAHDCLVGNCVIMANNATLAGHITIGNYAIVGGLVAIHQFVRVGDYAFIGGKSAVVKDIPPYVIAAGDRATLHGLNQIGLKRHGFTPATLAHLKKAYRLIFRIGITLNEALARVAAEVEPVAEVNHFIDFIKSSQRGVTR